MQGISSKAKKMNPLEDLDEYQQTMCKGNKDLVKTIKIRQQNEDIIQQMLKSATKSTSVQKDTTRSSAKAS